MSNIIWVSNSTRKKDELPTATIKFVVKSTDGKSPSYTLHVNTGFIKTAERYKWKSMKLGYTYDDNNNPILCVKLYESEVKNSINLLDKYKKYKKVLGVTTATNQFIEAGLDLKFGENLQLNYNKQSKLWTVNLPVLTTV